MKISDNHIKSTLGEAGLSRSEQEVYVVGMGLGSTTSAQIIKAARMPRPTVMAALKALTELELCETAQRDGRSYTYHMLPVQNLKTSVGRRIRQLDAVMARLDDLKILATAERLTQEASGETAVQDMLELALRCRSRKWQIIAPRSNALAFMSDAYKEYFKRVRSERQIESQSLWEASSKKDIPLKDVLMRKPRYVPKELGDIPSLMLAFDDNLLFISSEKGSPSAVLIQNQAVTATFQIIFEMAWRSVR